MSIAIAERAREEEALLRSDGRARDLDLLAVSGDRDPHEVRVVPRRRDALLGHLDPAVGGD